MSLQTSAQRAKYVPGLIPGHVGHDRAVDTRNEARELDRILEELSYELTAARTAGVAEPDELRATLRRARDLLAEADGLAASIGAEHRG